LISIVQRQRKNLSPAFAFRHIKDLYPTFWAKAQEVVEKMTATIKADAEFKEDGSAVLEVGEWASRVTLDIIGVAGMGHDFNSIQNPESELNLCYRKIFQPNRGTMVLQIIGVFMPFWILKRLPIARNQEVEDARLLIRRVCHELIDKKKGKLASGKTTDKDILSVAIESGGFSDENLVDQLMTFLAAGHETTASAMIWAAYLLCKHPDIQKRLREEIRNNLPSVSDSNAQISAADVEKLHYLWAVCNEILRFIPSVPLTLRTAAHDTTILDQPIPKGTVIILCPWAVNVSKETWGPDADQFNPERWMAAGKANTGGAESNYSFLTFLHGPRSCIGKDFAKAEFATLLASWVGKFAMEFADKDFVLDIAGALTSKPKGGLKVRMTPLDGW
jgi:cytochrome P450